MTFDWEIKVKGFGPFAARSGGKMSLSNAQVALYSANGQGKTCLSRLFRAADRDALGLAESLINRKSKQGSFSFAIAGANSRQELSVSMERQKDAVVVNRTNCIFHVFNSDYVRDNLASRHFSPSEDGFSGYILGKENIVLTDKKERLDVLTVQRQLNLDDIEKAVDEARSVLAGYKLTSFNAYKELTPQKILSLPVSECDYDAKLAEFQALRNLPDAIPTLAGISFDATSINFGDISKVLTHEYTRDDFADEFVAEVLPKRDFIARGLELRKNDVCPFCKREFNDEARELIQAYEDYVSGKEAKTIADIERRIQKLQDIAVAYRQFSKTYRDKVDYFVALRPAFPSLSSSSPNDIPSAEDFSRLVDALINVMTVKAADISIPRTTEAVEQLRNLFARINDVVNASEELFVEFDKLASRTSKSLTGVKRGLCTEMAQKVRNESDALIVKRRAIEQAYSQLEDEIRADEAHSRKSKREAVAETLAKMVHAVFGNKYAFDPVQFTISMDSSLLGEQAENVLSEGEKSVIAFCHFIASTWNLLDSDDDVSKLFFVIDDPISSLDYHYVYSVVQIIRDLKEVFHLDRVRFLLMTHNAAFFNMLARNNVAKEQFVLHDGAIEKCNRQYIAPYYEHLKDLHKIALGTSKPSHTTGNSIRQIIESLWRFDNPAATSLRDYLDTEECSDLKDCEYIYSMFNDLSHGATVIERDQLPDDEPVRRACWSVLNHIHKRYPGQLIVSAIDYQDLRQP